MRIRRLRLVSVVVAVILGCSAGALTAAMTRPDAARSPPHVFAFISYTGGRGLADLARVGREISIVAPNWYALDLRTGAVSSPSETSALLDEARRLRVAVWPVINARATGAVSLGDPSVARRLVSAIARIGTARGYAGVTIDIEGLAASERAAFSSLVARVAATLHRHRRGLAVYAPGGDGVGSGAAYDWSSLARSANLLLVSTYAGGVRSSTPGPASSRTSFADAAAEAAGVSTRKVAPTLEAVGYSWPLVGGRAKILSAAGAARRRVSCRAKLTTRNGAASFTCHGDRVYYPTARELRAQVRDARYRGLKWIGLFSLGREPAGFWKRLVTAR